MRCGRNPHRGDGDLRGLHLGGRHAGRKPHSRQPADACRVHPAARGPVGQDEVPLDTPLPERLDLLGEPLVGLFRPAAQRHARTAQRRIPHPDGQSHRTRRRLFRLQADLRLGAAAPLDWLLRTGYAHRAALRHLRDRQQQIPDRKADRRGRHAARHNLLPEFRPREGGSHRPEPRTALLLHARRRQGPGHDGRNARAHRRGTPLCAAAHAAEGERHELRGGLLDLPARQSGTVGRGVQGLLYLPGRQYGLSRRRGHDLRHDARVVWPDDLRP